MSHLRSLPADTTLLQVFQAYPGPARPLLDLHEAVMRAPSPLSPGERELIAAYVSGLNGCDYCRATHTATAEAFDIPEGTVAAALADLDTSPVSERMKPLLRLARTLTHSPADVSEDDVAAVRAAGWDEQAVHDAVLVCGLFNLMNRMVEGLGIRADDAYVAMAGKRLRDGGYLGLAALLNR